VKQGFEGAPETCQISHSTKDFRPAKKELKKKCEARVWGGLELPDLVEAFAEDFGGFLEVAAAGQTGAEGDAQAGDGEDAIGAEEAEVPGGRGAPVMADDEGAGLAEGVEEGDEVADDVQGGVVVDGRRGVGAAAAAEVGRDDAEAGVGESRDLVAPGVPELREPVQQQQRRPRALLYHMHADPVHLQRPMLHPRHPPRLLHLLS
jgi:hypothetical protein